MDFALDPHATRVLGALMEKSLTTPDYYPLSLAALTSACNQKSSRDPVMSLTESDVRAALDGLIQAHLVRERSSAGARVSKFAHRLDDELGLSFGFSRAELAVLSLLMLRGPQTAGELRNRSARAHAFEDVPAVEHVLRGLAAAERGPYVQQLSREPGRRECRFQQLFSEASGVEVDHTTVPSIEPQPSPQTSLERRVEALEREVQELRASLMQLRNNESRDS